jgi:hypothetical protein
MTIGNRHFSYFEKNFKFIDNQGIRKLKLEKINEI